MTEFFYSSMGFVAGIAAGWIASRLGVAWRDMQRSRVDTVKRSVLGRDPQKMKVKRNK